MESPIAGPSMLPTPKQHDCTYEGCGKSYAKPSKLAQHIRSHTGERPFVCSEEGCKASYMRNEHLKAHQRQHLNPEQKPFHCAEASCSAAFWTSSQLKNHIRSCHTEDDKLSTVSGQQSYSCAEPDCDKAFHKRKNLRLHIRQDHYGCSDQGHGADSTTPFACSDPGCALRFATNSKRKSHAKVHQPHRYTCAMDHADPQDSTSAESSGTGYIYNFPTWSALQTHIRTSHPRVCPWPNCGKEFSRHDSLRTHYRRHEARKLRLELESRTIEMSQEAQLNHRRAGLSDDSEAFSSEDNDSDSDEKKQTSPFCRKEQLPIVSSSYNSPTLSLPSEEELIHQAAQLTERRPRRGGIFKGLHSTALSMASTASASDNGTSRRSETTATGITAEDGFAPVSCSWNGCPKTYTNKRALSVHVRTVHLGEKPFDCSECGKSFAHKHLVTRHRRICPGQDASSHCEKGSLLRNHTTTNLKEGFNAIDRDLDSDSESFAAQAEPAAPQSDIRTKLLDLLTGYGYSLTSAEPQSSLKRSANESEDMESIHPKKRVTRDRVFNCPWNSIQTNMTGEIDPQVELDLVGPPFTALTATSLSSTCEFRFRRIYDLRRHLHAHHGLGLEDREIRAWFRVQESVSSSA